MYRSTIKSGPILTFSSLRSTKETYCNMKTTTLSKLATDVTSVISRTVGKSSEYLSRSAQSSGSPVTAAQRQSRNLLKTFFGKSTVTLYLQVHKWAQGIANSEQPASEIFSVPKDVDGEELAMMLNISLHNDVCGFEVVYVVKAGILFIRKTGGTTVGIPQVKIVSKDEWENHRVTG
jgi:hypothetical protein